MIPSSFKVGSANTSVLLTFCWVRQPTFCFQDAIFCTVANPFAKSTEDSARLKMFPKSILLHSLDTQTPPEKVNLDSKNIPETPSQEVFGCLGNVDCHPPTIFCVPLPRFGNPSDFFPRWNRIEDFREDDDQNPRHSTYDMFIMICLSIG